jgi:two-component system, chemotaxis family, sensor kinase CheA
MRNSAAAVLASLRMLSAQPSSPPPPLRPPALQHELSTPSGEDPALPTAPPALLRPPLEAPPKVSVGIRIKLIALMVGTSFLIASVLTSYLTARQIAGLRENLRERAAAYGRLASLQLRSAIAFKDAETAREVLSAINKDPLVLGVALYREDGTPLHGQGTLSELAQAARRGFGEARTFSLPGRMLMTVPVRSLEGPRGTLVMELTTAPANATRAQLIRAAMSIGSGALLLGIVLAWGIAHSLARRVEGIARAASEVAQGDFERTLALNGPRDEIGVLAHAFDAMVRHLRELIGHINRTASEEKVRLEQLVGERTAQLDRKNIDLQLVLDNVEQGFVTIDRAGIVVGEQSRIIARWLGQVSPGDLLWSSLDRASPGRAGRFDAAWLQVVDGFMPAQVCLAQMPQECLIAGRYLRFEYNPLGSPESFEKLLVVISDATAVVERDRNEQQERDLLNLSSRLLHDRAGFMEFASDTELLLERIRKNASDPVLLKRDLHTLKGNSGLFGLSTLAALCHTQESNLEIDQVDCSAIVEQWQSICQKTRQLVGERSSTGLEIDQREYQAVLHAVRTGCGHGQLLRMIEAWELEPVRVRLERAAEQLLALAERTGKRVPTISVVADRVYLARDELSEFWSVFAHVVRNGVTHGLAQTQCSAREHDPAANDFELCARVQDGSLFVEFADHGPGIDWNIIRLRAKQHGLPADTQAQLMDALFSDGVSAESEVTEFSGRGVGLSAVRDACQRQSGTVLVTTVPGAGTTFQFSWPTRQFKSLIQLDSEPAI